MGKQNLVQMMTDYVQAVTKARAQKEVNKQPIALANQITTHPNASQYIHSSVTFVRNENTQQMHADIK